MKIGIDASRAFIQNRTGIEEYSYQVIKHLMSKFRNHQVVLYVRKNQKIDFTLPANWKEKVIKFPFFWTQIGLSLEILFNPIDALFVPAHIVPWILSGKTIVTIHGLEYEFCPKAYSFWERLYMRFFIKRSCKKSSKIVAVSENTKKDLIELYKIKPEKMEVVYEGVNNCHSREGGNPVSSFRVSTLDSRLRGNDKYLLFIGRLEERKNIQGIVEAFEAVKEKYKVSHKLVLAGKPGYGYEKIKNKIESSKFEKDILELGFISDKEKWTLLKNAEVFLFPTFYEGFGLPILEAQIVGTSVVTSNVSSMPEVAGNGALLVDPGKSGEIAEAVWELISDEKLKNDIIEKGHQNVKRFSWDDCSEKIAKIIES